MEARKIKHELLLEGLDCANCAAKIENSVKKVKGVEECSVNFATKTLSFETGEQSEEEILTQAKNVVVKLEPGIHVRNKNTALKQASASKSNVLILEGLDCANCAAKIEKAVGQMPDVTTSNVDFVSKKLRFDVADPSKMQGTVANIKETVPRLEPHIKVLELNDGKSRVGEDGHTHDHVHGHSHEHGHEHDHGEKSLKPFISRLLVGAVFTAIPLFGNMGMPLELALYLIGYLLVGGDILWRAFRNITRGQVFDEFFLMSVATIGAFIIGEYPEGVAVMLFFQMGELLQSIAVNRSRKSISALMDIRPDYANLKVNGEIKKVSPEEINIGNLIVVKPGEKIPLDGKVVEGSSSVDTSALTGESLPRDVEIGNEVLSGCININGVLTIEVTKAFAESTVSKILELVENASSRKSPTETYITKFARYYTPVVVIIAAFLAVLPPLLFEGQTFSDWFYRALVFLVISCPCALVVSVPLGYFGGIGGSARQGILMKGSNYLEALTDAKYVVFDKTGTLTKGVFQVTSVVPSNGLSRDQVVEYAAMAEVHSNHPIALSIQKAYGKEINESAITEYNEISGHGIEVVAKGNHILAGNKKLMEKEGIQYIVPTEVGTVVHVAVNRKYAGYIIIADELKEDAARAIKELKALGIKKTVMLTGDAQAVGESVGKKLGLDEVRAELLPHQKVEELEKIDALKGPKEKLIFVGDGINDTPVLARADVGVAMGGLGSDAAIEAADVVIMTDEPSKLAEGIRKAKHTRSIVLQNIILALGVKGIFLLLGAMGFATLWEAVIADVGVTLVAVLNSMRVLRVRM